MPTIIDELNCLPCLNKIISLEKIEQGYSHECYKVLDEKGTFFAKRLTTYQHNETITDGFDVSSILKNTPQLIYNSHQWQIYEYLEGQSLLTANISIEEKVKYSIELMVQCHQQLHPDLVPASLTTLKPQNIISPLLSHLPSDQQCLVQKIIEQLSQELHIGSSTVCHGDINFSNIILTDKPWIIDFECSCLADAEFDIAMMIAVNELTLAANSSGKIIDNCLKIYQEKHTESVWLSSDLVTRYLLLCFIINGLWYLKEGGRKQDSQLVEKAYQQFIGFDKLHFVSYSLTSKMR